MQPASNTAPWLFNYRRSCLGEKAYANSATPSARRAFITFGGRCPVRTSIYGTAASDSRQRRCSASRTHLEQILFSLFLARERGKRCLLNHAPNSILRASRPTTSPREQASPRSATDKHDRPGSNGAPVIARRGRRRPSTARRRRGRKNDQIDARGRPAGNAARRKTRYRPRWRTDNTQELPTGLGCNLLKDTREFHTVRTQLLLAGRLRNYGLVHRTQRGRGTFLGARADKATVNAIIRRNTTEAHAQLIFHHGHSLKLPDSQKLALQNSGVNRTACANSSSTGLFFFD